MSLFAQAGKATEHGRTEGRKTVLVLATEAEAIAAGLTLENMISPDSVDAKIVFRTVVINDIVTKPTKNPEYVQDAMIGRDIATNSTLRTWAVRKVTAPAPVSGDMAEFPAVHVPKGFFAVDGKQAVKSLTDTVYASTSAKNAEIWNEKRQQGFAKAIAAVSMVAKLVEA